MKLICYFTFLVIVNSLKKKTQKKNPHKLVKKEKKKSNENYEIDQIKYKKKNLSIKMNYFIEK